MIGLKLHQIRRRRGPIAQQIRLTVSDDAVRDLGLLRCDAVDGGESQLGQRHGCRQNFFRLGIPFRRHGLGQGAARHRKRAGNR